MSIQSLGRAMQLWDAPEELIAEWATYPRKHRHEKLVASWVGEAKRVADLGCGSGRFAEVMVYSEYVGYDMSNAMLSEAKGKNILNASFEKCNIYADNLSKGKFDVGIHIDVAFHQNMPASAILKLLDCWDVERLIFSLAVGDKQEDLLLSTVIPLSNYLNILDNVEVGRVHVERYVNEAFAWILTEVYRK